jgi:oxygen-independent coproporphyrinogen-3 oxidase
MIREFILRMKLGRVETSHFQEKYGVDVLARWEDELTQLTGEGLLRVEGKEIILERDGLLCVDNILHDFFLPEHRTDKLV